MPATLKLEDRDFGWKHLQGAVLKLGDKGAFTLVGVQGAQGAANVQSTALTYAQLARIHEFGTARIPARSFLYATIEKHKAEIQKRATAFGRGVLMDLFTVEKALELLGEYVVGLIRQRIADGIAPPNAPSTIKRKGSSKPLIDSGGLRAAISHRPEGG